MSTARLSEWIGNSMRMTWQAMRRGPRYDDARHGSEKTREQGVTAKRQRQVYAAVVGRKILRNSPCTVVVEAYARIMFGTTVSSVATGSAAVACRRARSLLTVFGARGPVAPVGYSAAAAVTTLPPPRHHRSTDCTADRTGTPP